MSSTSEVPAYDGNKVSKELIEFQRRIFERFFRATSNKHLFICFTEPERLNQRVAAQQGLFLCPSVVTCNFEACLVGSMAPADSVEDLRWDKASTVSPEDARKAKVLKIVFPAAEKPSIQRDLARMNITAASLFPGLEGYIKSLWNDCTRPIPDRSGARDLSAR